MKEASRKLVDKAAWAIDAADHLLRSRDTEFAVKG